MVWNSYQKCYILACYLLINRLFVTKIHMQTYFKHIVVGPNQKIFSQPQSGHRRSHESISVRNSLIPQKPALAQIVWLSGQVLLTNLIRIALVYTTSKIHHQVTNLLTKKDVAKPKKFLYFVSVFSDIFFPKYIIRHYHFLVRLASSLLDHSYNSFFLVFLLFFLQNPEALKYLAT